MKIFALVVHHWNRQQVYIITAENETAALKIAELEDILSEIEYYIEEIDATKPGLVFQEGNL